MLILLSVLRTALLTLFTRADFLHNDLLFDPLTPVTSSNRGSNQNLVNARFRTQDRKPGTIFHLHCVRPRACRPPRNSERHFCLTLHSANYSLVFNFSHFIRRLLFYNFIYACYTPAVSFYCSRRNINLMMMMMMTMMMINIIRQNREE